MLTRRKGPQESVNRYDQKWDLIGSKTYACSTEFDLGVGLDWAGDLQVVPAAPTIPTFHIKLGKRKTELATGGSDFPDTALSVGIV